MRRIETLIGAAAFGSAALLALGGATVAVNYIEALGREQIEERLEAAGQSWARVETDGLQVILDGTAPTEAARFRALSLAGQVLDPARVIDRIEIAASEEMEAPQFSVELLRNDDGISLIGLVPLAHGRERIVERIGAITDDADVADMLDSTDHPVPEGWEEAVAFGLETLELLPRSKISISPGRVQVTAISDSREEKRELETQLSRIAPQGVEVEADISAPRPVITPFTLRFVIDEERGPRFDACAADTEAARERILDAGRQAGASASASCTIGLGVPTTRWAQAASAGIGALGELGEGTITFSDTDVSLIVPHSVPEEEFDSAVGRLDNALGEVFSLDAARLDPSPDEGGEAPAEFIASLSAEGAVLLRGQLADERMREAVHSYARSRFGQEVVESAARLEEGLPEGWTLRVLTAMEALAELNSGLVRVREDSLEVRGVSGDEEASGTVSRILSEKLGRGQVFRIDVSYDESLDPIASAPTPESCIADIELILEDRQIGFEPGSSVIEGESSDTLDAIAAVLRECGELRLEIEGHTDSQGSEEMNLNLSQRRAEAVLEALVARRVLVGQFNARGYGPSQPIADNDTAAGRAANRRIEFRLISEEELRLAESGIRPRDPELEAMLEITVEMAEEDNLRPAERPERE